MPTPPLLILLIVIAGRAVLVKVHAILEPGAVAAASSTTDPAARLGVNAPPVPRPVHLIPVVANPGFGVSVIVVAIDAAVRVCKAAETAVPAVTVAIVCDATPFVPLKVNAPTPPLLTLLKVTTGSFALVKLHVKAAAILTALPGMVSVDPVNAPMGPVPLPVIAVAESKQLALVTAYPVAGVSVMVMGKPMPDTGAAIAAGAAGVAAPATVVLIAGGVPDKLAALNEKGPPKPPIVVFCTLTVGAVTGTVRLVVVEEVAVMVPPKLAPVFAEAVLVTPKAVTSAAVVV